jgi:hypothetical protein
MDARFNPSGSARWIDGLGTTAVFAWWLLTLGAVLL